MTTNLKFDWGTTMLVVPVLSLLAVVLSVPVQASQNHQVLVEVGDVVVLDNNKYIEYPEDNEPLMKGADICQLFPGGIVSVRSIEAYLDRPYIALILMYHGTPINREIPPVPETNSGTAECPKGIVYRQGQYQFLEDFDLHPPHI